LAKPTDDEPWMTLRRIIDLFVAMGCDPREYPGQEVEAFADWQVYYLYSPLNDCFVDLTGFDLDDHVAPTVVETWERALGVTIPRPKDWQ
jgi:hypothetical protein